MAPPLITLEEHFLSTAFSSSDEAKKTYFPFMKAIPGLADKLSDLSTLRLQGMDAGHVSLQIVSHAPGQLTVSEARDANDQLGTAIESNPDRLKGFATLPVADPDACAAELRRTIKDKTGFVGALIDSHTRDGVYYDGTAYDVMWAEAEKLDVPIYLHPTFATEEITAKMYTGNFSMGATGSISTSAWGWHSDVAVHFLRLFAAGVFDKFPKLKLVIGHFGEMVPFMLDRVQMLSSRWGERKRGFRTVWDENVWITTSGVWSVDPMRTILANTRVERILYSVDYPFAMNEWGLKWWEDLEKTELVSQEDLKKIAHGNAEELLGVKATKTF